MADKPLRVLLVDDNPQDKALVRRELRTQHPDPAIIDIADQEQLDAALAEGEFDIVITDYQLQWSTGLRVLEAVKSRRPLCPVIMFTATGTEEVAVEAMRNGLDDYIIKNVKHLVRLRASVRAALEHAQNVHDLQTREAELFHVTRLSTLGEMVACITHEVNQPLHAIANYARGSIIRLDSGSKNLEPFREAVEQISEQADRAADILRKYRGYMSRHRPDHSTFDVNQLLRDAAQLLAFDIGEQQVSAQWELLSHCPMVVADRNGIYQVAVNLIRNACEAMQETGPAEREIEIGTRTTDTHVEVSIRDRGHGLPADGYEGLLRPFVTTKADGMGMGLAVSSRIVAAHGGKLWATPHDGPGATFHFSLPLAETREGGS